jgi:hypothetical protein
LGSIVGYYHSLDLLAGGHGWWRQVAEVFAADARGFFSWVIKVIIGIVFLDFHALITRKSLECLQFLFQFEAGVSMRPHILVGDGFEDVVSDDYFSLDGLLAFLLKFALDVD